jgi:hypothetical protein
MHQAQICHFKSLHHVFFELLNHLFVVSHIDKIINIERDNMGVIAILGLDVKCWLTLTSPESLFVEATVNSTIPGPWCLIKPRQCFFLILILYRCYFLLQSRAVSPHRFLILKLHSRKRNSYQADNFSISFRQLKQLMLK